MPAAAGEDPSPLRRSRSAPISNPIPRAIAKPTKRESSGHMVPMLGERTAQSDFFRAQRVHAVAVWGIFLI